MKPIYMILILFSILLYGNCAAADKALAQKEINYHLILNKDRIMLLGCMQLLGGNTKAANTTKALACAGLIEREERRQDANREKNRIAGIVESCTKNFPMVPAQLKCIKSLKK